MNSTRLVRLGATLALALGAGAATAPGCVRESGGAGGDEGVAEARQAVTTPQACLQIYRGGPVASIADTQIANKLPPKNYGASQTMNTGPVAGEERRSLLSFDLGVIPGGPYANIQSAYVTLAQGGLPPSGPGTIEVHRVTAPWTELGVTWQSLGGAFDPAVEASFPSGSAYYLFNIPSLVTQWVHGTAPNHGLLLLEQGNESTNFFTSEHENQFFRPALHVCFTVTCAPGLADCNVNGLDGCEIDTANDPLNCGGCGVVCPVPPNAAAACIAGVCGVGACNPGFGDCDQSAANGCETMLTTATDCGACGVPCAPANGSASCATGTCTLNACSAGFYDCDGDPTNGCEAMPCADGSHCSGGAGCQSGVCANGICAAPGCADAVQNGNETDVDCGGGACPPCASGLDCLVGSDCAGGVCTSGICQSVGCADGVKNGAETDVDCGGGTCPACNAGQQCQAAADCAGSVCLGGVCQAAACNDSVQNGGETAIDCGGHNACPRCPPGQACLAGSDCADLVCVGGVCQMASCSDGVKNGGESDVDCGGTCAPCNPAQHCQSSADCDSGVCVSGLCQPATCGDGVKNGDETGVDCGGACFVAETCNGVDDDCNGAVDEGLGSTTCGLGACQVTVPNCVGGQPQTCVPGAPQAELCDGTVDDDCDGVVDNGCACVNGATQPCYTGAPSTIGVGACHTGTQTCMFGQWGACVGEVTPVAETCDGIDNDCNGQTDEGLGQTVCGAGACQVTVSNCVGGQPQTCVPGTPQPETCDGIDNDCNGQVDEGNPGSGVACSTGLPGICAAGTTTCSTGQIVCAQTSQPAAETCNGLDDDCDGVADDGDPGGGAACSTGLLGVCASGTTVCSGGLLQCQQSAQPGAETCNGLDDDCDGQVDEGNPGGGAACNTGLLGVCAAGTTACAGGQIACNQDVQPSAEVCDGLLDQDCDGQVDEGCACVNGATQTCYGGAPGTAGVGICHAGTQTCVGGAWGPCTGQVTPQSETCNGIDDDCDGQVDEGNPGGGVACSTGQQGICAAGTSACSAGTLVCNRTNAPANETCNGLDDDCDGQVDEGNPGGGAACSTGLPGICSNGTTTCSGGALACTPDQAPQAETCNVLDDDCNGQIDENNACGTCGGTQDPTGNGGTVGGGTVAGGTVGASASITFSNQTTSGAEECAAVGRTCSSATNNGSSVGCTNNANFQTGAAVCGGVAGAGVNINNQTSSGAQACAEVGRACIAAYNNGVSVGCTNNANFANGTALCGTASGGGVTIDSQTSSGAQACAKVGRPCSQAYNNGVSVGCNNNANFTNGSALCLSGTGYGVTVNNQTTSGAEECAIVGRSCAAAYNNGISVGCNNNANFTNGSALCSTCVGAGAVVNNQVTSGAEECAIVGRSCAAAYNNGISVGCNNSANFTNGSALCSTCVGAGAVVNNQVTSGAEECAILGRTCSAAYDNGISINCNSSNSFDNGGALCGGVAGVGITINNQTTSGSAECGAIGRSCVAAYDNGISINCNSSNGFDNGGALCGALTGSGVNITNKTTSGTEECAKIGRSCLQAYDNGISVNCNSSNGFDNGSANCGGVTGTGVAFSNQTTSGRAKCAAIGRTCTQAYDNGIAVSCTTTNAFQNGAALCVLTPTGTGTTFSSQTTSGNEECAIIGKTCTAAYDSGTSLSCSSPNAYQTGVALCSLADAGVGTAINSQITSGNEECAILGRTCVAAYDNGSSLSCSSPNSYQNGGALCNVTQSGIGASINNKITSGLAECAAHGSASCAAAYDNGSSVGCGSANSYQNGGVLCGSANGTGISWSSQTTTATAKCAAIGLVCVKAYDNGSSVSCSTNNSYQNGTALCQ